MKRLILFLSLSALIAVVYFSAPSVLAQGAGLLRADRFGLIQKDYDEYAALFKNGKEPNLSPSDAGNERWRTLYRNHRWAEFAEGDDFNDPIPAAQTLMGIYLMQHVDHRLSYQIETIIWNKAYLSGSLAERITLDTISSYWSRSKDPVLEEKVDSVGEGDDFYAEHELERLALQRRDIDVIARGRLINPHSISNAMRSEVQVVRNLFDHGESYRNWVLTYYFMREKFDILDKLADSFTFNWSPKRRADALQELRERDEIRMQAQARAEAIVAADIRASNTEIEITSSDSHSNIHTGVSTSETTSTIRPGSVGYSMDDVPAMTDQLVPALAAESLRNQELRENAYKYVVGVYESTAFHLGTLRKIHRYFEKAAATGDPIAQYHLAVFLKYLGDIVDPLEDAGTRTSRINKLLAEAEASDLAKKRVEDLNDKLALEVRLAGRRTENKDERVKALRKVEDDKIDLFDTVLLGVRQRISEGTGVGGMMGGIMSGGMMGGGMGYGSSGNNNRSSSRSGSGNSNRSSRNSRDSDSSNSSSRRN